MCHDDQLTASFGVIKAFLDADLLPRVITGTSAGGLVAALLCTRTNDELKQLIVPRLADKITACSDSFTVWFKRFLKTGARFSSVEWAEKVRWLLIQSKLTAGYVFHKRLSHFQGSV